MRANLLLFVLAIFFPLLWLHAAEEKPAWQAE
jgi:hypothetical protein